MVKSRHNRSPWPRSARLMNIHHSEALESKGLFEINLQPRRIGDGARRLRQIASGILAKASRKAMGHGATHVRPTACRTARCLPALAVTPVAFHALSQCNRPSRDHTLWSARARSGEQPNSAARGLGGGPGGSSLFSLSGPILLHALGDELPFRFVHGFTARAARRGRNPGAR